MFNDIGRKIKLLASIVAWGGIIGSIISGIGTFVSLNDNYMTEDFAFVGIIVAIVGAISSWIGSFVLYGFGELIDQTTQINSTLGGVQDEGTKSAKIEKLKEWKTKGLITEDEYLEKLKEL